MTPNTPIVSVVIPFFNAETTLERSVCSILAQTYHNIELILVNNNSTDSSLNIASQLAKNDHRIVILNETKQGVTYAANTGNNHATGKYIARMDADDYSHPQRIEKQVELLELNTNIGLVSCLVKHVPHQPNTEGLFNFVEWVNTLVTPEQIFNSRFIETPIINPTVLFRRELLQQHGGYQHGNFPEDYELWIRWLANGVKMTKVTEVLFNWHDSNTRLTRTDQRYSSEAFYRIKTTYLYNWLTKTGKNNIWIWGAGRLSRKRVAMLEEKGLKISGYIDVKNRKPNGVSCVEYKAFDWSLPVFVISYVGNRGAREKINDFLVSKGKKEGADFIFVA